jgi:hypothetical protein
MDREATIKRARRLTLARDGRQCSGEDQPRGVSGMVSTGRAKGAWGYVAAAGVALCATAVLAAENGPQPAPANQGQAAESQSAPKAAATPAKTLPPIAKPDKKAAPKDDSTAKKTAVETGDPIKWTDKIVAASAAASAFFALVLAWFTYRLIRVGRDQHQAATDSLSLAREEFITSNRPRIRIRHIFLTSGIEEDNPVTVDIHLVNVGDSAAIVKEIGIDFNVVTSGRRLSGNMIPPVRKVDEFRCGLGDTIVLHSIKTFSPLQADQVISITFGERILHCFGYIEYTDTGPEESRKSKRTAFCRAFALPISPEDGIGRFLPLDTPDPDYEFED